MLAAEAYAQGVVDGATIARDARRERRPGLWAALGRAIVRDRFRDWLARREETRRFTREIVGQPNAPALLAAYARGLRDGGRAAAKSRTNPTGSTSERLRCLVLRWLDDAGLADGVEFYTPDEWRGEFGRSGDDAALSLVMGEPLMALFDAASSGDKRARARVTEIERAAARYGYEVERRGAVALHVIPVVQPNEDEDLAELLDRETLWDRVSEWFERASSV